MKKIISILLALSMLFSLNTVAFAAESGTTDELQIVEENGTRTVSLNDGELTYIVTYDTVNNTICVAQKDNNTGLVEYGTVESTEITENSLVSARSKIHQDTFCNYEYDIYTGSPNEWNLERPKETGSGQNYFMVYENSSNSSQLDSWFNAVNSLNDKEWQAVSSYLPVAYKMVVLDIVLDDFLINAVCVCRFLSFPFRRRSRFPVVRQGI